MKQVPRSDVKSWLNQAGREGPRAISAVCPGCNAMVLFTLESHHYDEVRDTFASSAACPSCGAKSHFWTIAPTNRDTKNALYHGTVFMHPTAPDYHEALRFGEDVPEPLVRAYHSTVDAYNFRNFTATAVCCRRTLEGLFKYLLPEDKRGFNLARAIETARETLDLAKPLSSLFHAIRHGGNLGAHFDIDKEPTKRIAQFMVELLEYIISYLYVLPREIEKLDRSLSEDA
jgi:hypothetical protein